MLNHPLIVEPLEPRVAMAADAVASAAAVDAATPSESLPPAEEGGTAETPTMDTGAITPAPMTPDGTLPATPDAPANANPPVTVNGDPVDPSAAILLIAPPAVVDAGLTAALASDGGDNFSLALNSTELENSFTANQRPEQLATRDLLDEIVEADPPRANLPQIRRR